MKNGAPHIQFAFTFRTFLKKKKYQSPSDLHRDLQEHMGKSAPSLSAIWMAFYGARALPTETILFLKDRYDFEIEWQDVLPIKSIDGTVKKSNQMALPGMRELR